MLPGFGRGRRESLRRCEPLVNKCFQHRWLVGRSGEQMFLGFAGCCVWTVVGLRRLEKQMFLGVLVMAGVAGAWGDLGNVCFR